MKKITILLITLFASLWQYQSNAQIFINENLDSGFPSGWTQNSYFYSTTSTYLCEGTGNIADNMYNSSVNDGTLTSPNFANISNETDTVVEFQWLSRPYLSNAVDYIIYVEYSTNDGSSWNLVSSFPVTNTNPCTQFSEIIPAASLPSGSDFKFRIRGEWQSGDSYFYLDNILISQFVSCPQPSDLTANNLTDTTVDLGWVENGSASLYNVEVVTAGTTPTGTPTDTGVANVFTKTGLNPLTDYDFYVQADCGNSDVSAWVGPLSFSTLCPLYTPDYDADMSENVPDCWEIAGSGDLTSGPSDFGTSLWTTGSFNSGTPSNRINLYTNNREDWIISPTFDLSGAAPSELNVTVALTNTTTSGVEPFGSDDLVALVMSTDGGTTWAPLQNWEQGTEPSDTGDLITYDLSAITGNVQFAFYGTDGSVNDSEDVYFHVGQFRVRETPSCLDPTNLTATNITDSGADLGWVENGSASLYNIEVVPTGTTPNGTATDTGVANGFTKSGLASNTEYDYYVQADCGAGDLSSWSGPLTFKTACASFIPEYDADMSENVPDCWSEAGSGDLTSGPSDFETSLWTTGSFNSGTPSNRINLYTNNREDWIISPIFDLSGAAPSELNVTVALTNSTTSGVEPFGSDDLVALVMSTDGGTTWTPLQNWEQGTEPSDTGDQITYDLSAITGNVQFAFYGTDGSVDDSQDVYFHVGQFRVRETPSCPEPTGLMVTNLTTTSADISWTENGSATLYNVELVPAGTTPTGTATDAGVANGFTKTGLSIDNSYDVYVQADCGNGDTSIWIGPETIVIEYCESTPTSIDGSGISSLELNGTSFTSGGDIFYEDYTGTTVDLNQDSTVPASITFATGYTYGTHIWIDLNDDLVFEASELLFSGESLSPNPTTLDTSFSLSATAALGQHRMRIGTADSGQSTPNPCYEGTYGVTIDMTVNILPAAAIANDDCDGAEMLTLGTTVNADNTGATDSGMAGCLTGTISDVWYSFVAPISGEVNITVTGAGFQYELFSGADCTALTSVSCNTSNNGGLTASNTYYIRVNDDGTGANRATGAFSILVEEVSLSTNDIDTKAAFSYYPNPVKNTLTINAVSNTIDNVSVFNVLGQQVLAAQPKVLSSNLDMSNLQDGAYFVRVTIANTTQTIKVIKH